MGARHGSGGEVPSGIVMNLRQWAVRLIAMLRRRRLEAELDEDIRMHLQMAADENRRQGMSAQDAERAARRSFGNVDHTKEIYRDQRGIPLYETFVRDVRQSLRSLRRNPAFTLVAVLTLTLGIGANTAIFSITHSIVLRELPYANADRLTTVVLTRVQQNAMRMPFSLADYLDWREQNTVFEKAAAYSYQRATLTGNGSAEQVPDAFVTADFFTVLGAQAQLGRTFAPDDDEPGKTPGIVISHGLWQRRLHGDPQAIGQLLTVNGRDYPIVGVMSPDFEFGNRGTEVWRALILEPPGRRGPYFLWVIARLKAGVNLEQAQAEQHTIAARIEAAHPKENLAVGMRALSFHEDVVGAMRTPLYILLGAVFLVLLIAAANVANLLLERATAREREIAIRSALGASRGRLATQLLTESVVLSAIGAAGGIGLAYWGIEAVRQVAPSSIPRLQQIAIDTTVLLYTLGVSVLSGVIFGFFPALQSVRPPRLSRARIGNIIIVGEIALCLMLLVGAGLLLKSLGRLQQVDAGFVPANVLTTRISVNTTPYSGEGDERLVAFYEELLSRVRSLPGVESVGLGNSLPPDNLEITDSFSIEGRPWPKGETAPNGPVLFVSPDYFPALGIPLMRGRNFNDHDRLTSVPVTLINETFARRYFPNEDPIGKRIKVGGPERPTAPWMEIIGVVGDTKYSSLGGAFEPARYQSFAQVAWNGLHLVVKAAGDPMQLVPALRREVAALDKDVPLDSIRTMNDAMQQAVSAPRFRTMLLATFAALALVLAAIGIYGVMSYAVTRRRREIGIRLSLGARRLDVLKLVIADGLTLAAIGIALGLLGAFAGTRVLGTLLYEVEPTDPATFVLLPVFLFAVAAIACYVPAYRATQVDPLITLKCE
jgi:putative ABC transport system permease protein